MLIALVRGYQILSAPVYALMGGAVSACRFTPSCSHYAIEALQRHGSFRGTWLTARRLCRCHPWGGQGFDPVPRMARKIHFTEESDAQSLSSSRH